MSEYSCNHHQALALALEASFLDENVHSDETMQAKLLTNDFEKSNKVLTTINKELATCDNFMFSVAFITEGGITMLLNAFKTLKEKGIKGRILTSTYQFFNTPKTFRTLLKHQDAVDVRIYNTKNFHAKGYVFKQGDSNNFIIGSSNLTQHALTYNHEWNIKVNSTYQGALTKEIEREFNATWERSVELTQDWIDSYEEEYSQSKIIDINRILDIQKNIGLKLNKMQREALDALERIRNEGKNKAILISATGTGKTYLSAFDVKKVKPKKFLFVIHRENVARAAMESYKYVLGKDIPMAILSGNHKLEEMPADYIFATIQTLSKDKYLEKFDPSYFDYIVIDEVHRAGADTYTKIFNHFKPKFMLGMSATPERTDGVNIVELFDYNIAYEIRLQDAMRYNLLAPFHYFGIQELMIDGNIIDESVEFNRLIHEDRINHIISNLDYYGYSGNRPRGLIFCSRNDEASELSAKFNEKGFQTVALSGASSEESRRIAIDRLEQYDQINGLDYVFTVDIFNEGIDIPKVNQVVMLRPTQSSIIFIQQLGRGLRKAEDKDYVVVLDFIGNYQNNYMIPIALSGDRTHNKDKLRRFAQEGSSLIQGCSTINFDEVTQKKIYESINRAKFSQVSVIKKEYQYLKQVVGRIPTLTDFYEHGAIDPMIIHEKFESYHTYLKKYEPEYQIQLTQQQEMLLKMLTKEISNSKRPHEILIIEMLLENVVISIDLINGSLDQQYGIKNDNHSIESAISLLSHGFLQNKHRERYNGCNFLKKEGNKIIRSEYFTKILDNDEFKTKLIDFIKFSKLKYEGEYGNRYDATNFVLYQKYTRKDVCRLLNWDQDESSTLYGYKIKYNTCPIFVTYNKDDSIPDSIKYEDEFINRHQFSWMTRNKVKLSSKEAVAIRNQNKINLEIHLFIKKANDEGSEHYYLGKMNYLTMKETEIKDKNDSTKSLPIVNVKFAMDESIREDIFDYLINR